MKSRKRLVNDREAGMKFTERNRELIPQTMYTIMLHRQVRSYNLWCLAPQHVRHFASLAHYPSPFHSSSNDFSDKILKTESKRIPLHYMIGSLHDESGARRSSSPSAMDVSEWIIRGQTRVPAQSRICRNQIRSCRVPTAMLLHEVCCWKCGVEVPYKASFTAHELNWTKLNKSTQLDGCS